MIPRKTIFKLFKYGWVVVKITRPHEDVLLLRSSLLLLSRDDSSPQRRHFKWQLKTCPTEARTADARLGLELNPWVRRALRKSKQTQRLPMWPSIWFLSPLLSRFRWLSLSVQCCTSSYLSRCCPLVTEAPGMLLPQSTCPTACGVVPTSSPHSQHPRWSLPSSPPLSPLHPPCAMISLPL